MSSLFTRNIAQSPATQTVNVVVSDSAVPIMTATQSFTVTVIWTGKATLYSKSAKKDGARDRT